MDYRTHMGHTSVYTEEQIFIRKPCFWSSFTTRNYLKMNFKSSTSRSNATTTAATTVILSDCMPHGQCGVVALQVAICNAALVCACNDAHQSVRDNGSYFISVQNIIIILCGRAARCSPLELRRGAVASASYSYPPRWHTTEFSMYDAATHRLASLSLDCIS